MTDFHSKGLSSGLKPKSMGGTLGGEKTAPAAKMGGESEEKGEGGKAAMELHDHGDGTAHTMIEGEKADHPDMHHALAHLAHKAMGGGDHFHAHKDDFGTHSHSINAAGEHSETQEHNSPEEAHSAMDLALGGEGGNSGDGDGDGDDDISPSLSGLHG